MLVGLNKNELKKAFREAIAEWEEEEIAKREKEEVFVDIEEEDDTEDPVDYSYSIKRYMDEGECFPLLLAKGHVSFDGKFKTSYILKVAREKALDLFCAFMDETGYDVDKMIAIADYYEDLLRKGEMGKLHGNFNTAGSLREIFLWNLDLMEALATHEHENEHRLYIVTMTERFCELVRYLEMMKDGGCKDFSRIDEDKGFLHLVWKYDEDITSETINWLIDGMEKAEEEETSVPKKFLDFVLNFGRDSGDDASDIFDDGEYDSEEDADDDVSGDFDCYEEMYAEIDGLEEGITPEESESDEANPEITES